jgi:hypothetical protein
MKKTTKAVLWSGLVFPGAGHFFLKQNQRGMFLFIPALVSACLYFYGRYVQVAYIWDKISSGVVSPDTAGVTALLGTVPQFPIADMAFWVLVACWVLGMVDAYLLARQSEQQTPSAKSE